MSTFLFLFRELLGSIRARSALLFSLVGLFILISLASFATLLLAGGTSNGGDGALGADELVLHLSPRLSAETVDDLYAQIRQRSDVASISFRFAEEVSPGSTGGRFFIRTTSPEATAGVLSAVESMNGITAVESGAPAPVSGRFALPGAARIGLLVALIVSVALSLLVSRLGYAVLLSGFYGEIRVMRSSGTSERTIIPPVVGLGLLIGLLTGLLLIVGIYLAQYALAEASAEIGVLANGGRVLGTSFASLVLGLLLGGLSGLFGASLLSSREFMPLR
jgi:cell division protein FtsX